MKSIVKQLYSSPETKITYVRFSSLLCSSEMTPDAEKENIYNLSDFDLLW